jgi:hypothetical protein
MNRAFASVVALLIGGALAVAGCSTFSDASGPPAYGGTGYGGEWAKTGPSGTPGELPPGVSSSGD